MTRLLAALFAALAAALLAVAPAAAQTRLPPEGFADLAEQLMPSVVNIATTQRISGVGMPKGGPYSDLFSEDSLDHVNSLGSGFLISADGVIVTNNHVIEGADEIEVVFQSGERMAAEIVGRDPATDIAVLKVAADRPLSFVRFGDSRKIRVGDLVIAIGNPFGLGGSVTAGIVSARNRNIALGRYDDFIQTDAAINKGNSGGPLFNMAGEVVGVNTAIYAPTGGSVGVSFAAPSDLVQTVVDQILAYGETRRGWLGVRIGVVTAEAARRAGLSAARGALVTGVTPGSPAAKAGLRIDDIILTFDGRDIQEGRNLTRIVAETPINKTVPVEVARGGRRLTIDVLVARLDEGRTRIATRGPQTRSAPPMTTGPAEQGRVLGLMLSTLTPELRERFGVENGIRGLLVTSVDPGSDASTKLEPGDVIVEMQFEEVSTVSQAQRIAELAPRSRPVLLYISRRGEMTFRSLRMR